MELLNKKDILDNINDTTQDFLTDYIFSGFEKEEFTAEELSIYINDNIKYIEDLISESADSGVSIYNEDRLEWLKDNYSTYEEYIEEVGINSKGFNLMNTIGGAIFIENEREITEDLLKLQNDYNILFFNNN